MEPGCPLREDYEYERKWVSNLFLLFEFYFCQSLDLLLVVVGNVDRCVDGLGVPNID